MRGQVVIVSAPLAHVKLWKTVRRVRTAADRHQFRYEVEMR
jgi:hypothetical protein